MLLTDDQSIQLYETSSGKIGRENHNLLGGDVLQLLAPSSAIVFGLSYEEFASSRE
jgi:hypothetical protein